MQDLFKKIFEFTSSELLTSVIALLLGILTSFSISTKLLRRLLSKKRVATQTYSKQLSELTASLTISTAEVDKILKELSNVSENRAAALEKLEQDLSILEKRENETKKRIEDLQNVPLAVADYFSELTKDGEKRSAKRDYLLFGAGVIVSTIVAIILKLLGWG